MTASTDLGDSWTKITHAEIILRNGMIVEIRDGAVT